MASNSTYRGADRGWGFSWGFAIGVTLALVALLGTTPPPHAEAAASGITHWLNTNLGHSIWLFAVVAVLFAVKLQRLVNLLRDLPETPSPDHPANRDISALDQMLDVWTQVFIGIGVIWTAVGMRSALQTALGDPGAALTDDADDVLRRLVDGGILLALSTTIVGAVGGYLMRVIKTLAVGAELQGYFEALDRQEIKALLHATERIEEHLGRLPAQDNVAVLPGKAL